MPNPDSVEIDIDVLDVDRRQIPLFERIRRGIKRGKTYTDVFTGYSKPHGKDRQKKGRQKPAITIVHVT